MKRRTGERSGVFTMSDVILEGRSLSKTFRSGYGGRKYQALRDVSIQLLQGETLGLMGPSGCGKSTLARILLRLTEPTEGRVLFQGQDVTGLRGKALRPFRRQVQLIAQRPESFFDPRRRLGDSLVEPLEIFRLERDEKRVKALLEQVKLTGELLARYPHQVSGGEIQRLSLCRALLLSPSVLILDEPTSMLDISVQAQILEILRQLQQDLHLTYLLITHDRQVAEYMCGRIQVLESDPAGSRLI